MVFVQKWPFFQVFFLGNIGKEIVFYYILETKNAFIGYKNNKLKTVEKLTFSQREKKNPWEKGKTHGFGPKLAIFSTFCFLGNIGQENVFNDILETKNAFIGYKNNNLKTVEKLTFFQRG